MGRPELQIFFFDAIKDKMQPHQSMVDEIAELLQISNDSAYRRIRGDKQITFSEIEQLASHFRISIDQVLSSNNNSFLFYGNLTGSKIFNFEGYLNEMMVHVKMISQIPDHHFYFDAKDIPPFHYFLYPELSAFKLYFWMKTVLKDERFDKLKFERNELINNLLKIGFEIAEAYRKIRSTEIWVNETISSTIRQIEYCYDSGLFHSSEDCMKVYNELIELLDHIEEQADHGEKFLRWNSPTGRDNFQLYINDILLGHNTSLVIAGGKKFTFINYTNIHFMNTHNEKFCDHIETAFRVLLSKSSKISNENERDRKRFFNNLRDQVEEKKSLLQVSK